MFNRRQIIGAALAIPTLTGIRPVFAQSYPSRTVRLVVAFPPGSSTDIVARIFGQKLTERLGQPFIVENRPGAGGNIATALVAREKPDGYALLVHSVAYSVNSSLYKNAGYDALTSLIPAGFGANTPNVLFVNPDVPVKNLKELIEWARAGGKSYASSGIGTTTHLGCELLFRKLAKINVTHVPFSPAEAATNVVGGTVPIGSTSLPPALQFIRSGRLRAIAIQSVKRSPDLPELPTIAEQGFPGFDSSTWFGFFLPAGTPASIVEPLNAAFRAVATDEESTSQLKKAGLIPDALTVPEFRRFLESEVTKWAAVVKESGAEAN